MVGKSIAAACAVLGIASTACTGTVASPSGVVESTAPQSTPQAPAVSEILRRMSERYATASTYTDEATLLDVIRLPSGETLTDTGKVRTRWRKPDRLFIELLEKDDFFEDRLVAWTTPTGTKGWFLGKVEDHGSLDDALGAYQGVSHGITALVPRWLAAGGCRVSLDYVLEGESPCGTSTCFDLVSKTSKRKVTLSVDRTTFALRRYRAAYTVVPDPASTQRGAARLPDEARARLLEDAGEPFDVETTIDYTPVFDAPLAANAFEFTPPTDAAH